MEGSSNSRDEIPTSKCGAPVEKPPTRLQKHAPAALRLDEIASARTHLESCLTSACVIPLLSPLILSPPPPYKPEQSQPYQSTGGNNNNNAVQQGGRIHQACDLPLSAMCGWQHPAAASPLAEPSTLFAFFQTQCSLVQPTPTQ